MAQMMNKSTIGKGVIYLYIEAIATMFSGYVYWLILSKITSPSIIGTSSATLSFISIFVVIASMGIGGGIQRFLGKSIVNKKIGNIKGFINSSLLITGLGILGSSIIILLLRDWIYYSFKINFSLVIISIIVMGSTSFLGLLRAIIVPSLNTKIITTSSILSTIIKIAATVILVIVGGGVMGILIGFMLYPMISSIILTIAIKRTFYNQNNDIIENDKPISLFYSTKDIFIASITFWVPAMITTIGSQLGTIFVLVSNGANFAGIYFISFSLVTGISVIMSVLSTIAYPAISAMSDGRKRAVWRLIKISLIIIIPLSHALIFYSADILQLFGSNYARGSTNLQILILSILPTAIISGISVLVYAYGNNRHVLIIGLFTSIPRTLLYFIFVPIFGGNGAAITYLVGSIAGFVVSVIIANRIGLNIFWKQILLISIIPALLAVFLKFVGINYIFGITSTIVISYVLLLKLHIIDKEDIEDILKILPKTIANPMVYSIVKISNKLRRS
jgi:O-antigen/teichoic acid export membrane protein